MRGFPWIAIVVMLAVCLLASYAAYSLAGYSWNQVVLYRTPFGDYERSWVAGAAYATAKETSSTPRAVLVIVDGLRLDVAEQMPYLRTLRQYGSDMIAVTSQPSLSYPTWTTILSGASPDISGVTTNWFQGAVPVETLLDTALASGLTVAVSAPEDFAKLYDADRAQATFFRQWTEKYMSATYVNEAIALAEASDPSLIVVHLPDADEAGHSFGGNSEEYVRTVSLIDNDIGRLVEALQDSRTLFVIVADHGHIDAGGHGGWEPEVTRVPALFAGPPAALMRGQIAQTDIAPTLAMFLGVPIPRHAEGRARTEMLVAVGKEGDRLSDVQAREFASNYLDKLGISGNLLGQARTYNEVSSVLADARLARLAQDRARRLPGALVLAVVAFVVLAVLFWRIGMVLGAGVLVYYAVYNGLYFLVRGYHWSLSAFNTESLIQHFFNVRMADASLAGLVAAAVAAGVYPLLSRNPKGRDLQKSSADFLLLGPATVLAIIATLALQVAWFLWAWGAQVTWRLPDLMWGFKYNLDLVQVAALGPTALLSLAVTYLVGRYHLKLRLRFDKG